MPSNIIISNIDEVSVKVTCEPGIAQEIKEYFTFLVPGYQFTPQYKMRIWDGKIRLVSKGNQLYRGLVTKLVEFAEEHSYTWEYDNEEYNEEFSLLEAEQFIKKLNPSIETRDYQIKTFVDCIRIRRALLLSAVNSGKSFISYLICNKLLADGYKKGLIIVPTINLVEQLTKDFKDY